VFGYFIKEEKINKMEKGTRNFLILVGVVVAGVTAYYFYDKSKKKKGEVKGGVTADSKQNTVTFTRS
jgi:uncharacterized protein (UPF0333 family)